jgi:hypothetical protein
MSAFGIGEYFNEKIEGEVRGFNFNIFKFEIH